MFILTSSQRNVNSNQNRDCFLPIELERISFFKLIHIAGKEVVQGASGSCGADGSKTLPAGVGKSESYCVCSLNPCRIDPCNLTCLEGMAGGVSSWICSPNVY